jgi:CotH protein
VLGGLRKLTGAALLWAFSLLCPAVAAAAEPGDDPPAWMYSPSTVVAIDLTLPPASIEALESELEEKGETAEYQPGTFSLATTDGTPGGIGEFTAPQEVGIRLKGGLGSFLPLGEKAAFKVKFNFGEGAKFLGLKKMTLNNMVQDPSMVHEVLAYRAFKALGVPSVRTGYAWVRLNGESLGVYLNVEDLDDVALEKRFGEFDDPQHLYEGEAGDDVAVGGAGDFEVDEGDEEARGDLEALIAAVHDELAPDFSERVEPHADLVQMTRMWAVEKYVGHWDGYSGEDRASLPNNYYLYSDPLGRFQMLPWGTDQTWGVRVGFDEQSAVLFDACLADASCAATYETAAAQALAAIPPLDLGRAALCAAELLAPWQRLEPAATRPYSAGQIAAGIAETRDFIADRPAELAAWLGVAASSTPAEAQGCVDPEPTPAGAGPSGTRARRIAGRLRVKDVDGGLSTRLRLLRATRVSQVATFGARNRTRTACTVLAKASTPRVLVLPCRFSYAARERLRHRHLRLTLVTRLRAPDGSSETLTRRITVPRT